MAKGHLTWKTQLTEPKLFPSMDNNDSTNYKHYILEYLFCYYTYVWHNDIQKGWNWTYGTASDLWHDKQL